MHGRVGLWRKLSAEELMLLNCGVGEGSWESLGLQGDPTSPFWRRSALGVLWTNDSKAETPVLWPPHAKSWLIGKDSDDGRDWGQEENEMTEDEMAGWHHQLNGREFEWTPGVGVGQGGLACCDSWGCKESDTTEWLNWTELKYVSGSQLCKQISNLCIFVSWSSSFHKGLICWGILLVLVFWWHVYSTWLGIILPIPFFILRFPLGENPRLAGCLMSLEATSKVLMEAKREGAFSRAVGKFPSQSCLEDLWLGW